MDCDERRPGVLPSFTGVAVHDAWAPYDTDSDTTHALCTAHVLRELTAVTDTTGVDGFDRAAQAAAALPDLKTLVEHAVTAGRTDTVAVMLTTGGCDPS